MFHLLLPLITATAFGAVTLTPDEQRDVQRYPHMMQFLKAVDIGPAEPTPAGNEHLIRAPRVYQTPYEFWRQFLRAAAEDKLTNLRAFALLSREYRARGITVYGPGTGFEKAVADAHIDLGLALPAHGIVFGAWEPDSAVTDPEFLLRLTVVYREKYIHQFPDEVLPANIRVGTGDETDFYFEGKRGHGYLMTADLYYGEHGVGFKNVHGIGGQKRGLLGFFQRLLFFLPDAIHSMMIDEKRNAMVTEALIDTVVENFETREIYRIRYRDQP